MKIFTIGFTKKSAETFFTRLKKTGVRCLVDVRLNNVSQLSGFTKKDDLRYFTKAICNIDYVHVPALAPTAEMLDAYKKQKGDWDIYERQFIDLMRSRHIEEIISKKLIEGGCLLCSEEKPHHCHRRLVAEYLKEKWGDVQALLKSVLSSKPRNPSHEPPDLGIVGNSALPLTGTAFQAIANIEASRVVSTIDWIFAPI